MKKALTIIPFALVLYIVFKYNDSELFKSILKLLLNPDPDFAAPLFWQNYRMFIIGCLFVLLVIYYKTIWSSALILVRTYRDSTENNQRPELSVLQASFLFMPDKSRCFMVWIVELCSMGRLSLHFEKGVFYPWSIRKKIRPEKLSPFYQELVSIIFKDDNTLMLRPLLSNSNPLVEEVATKLYNQTKSENIHFFLSRKSSLIAWILSIMLLFEIPTYNALYQKSPGMIVFVLFSTIIFTLPFFVFSRQLPALVSGSWRSRLMLSGAMFFAIFPQILIFSRAGHHYFTTAFYPNLAAAIAVLIYNLPFFLKDNSLLSHIIGYKKYLSTEGSLFGEEELCWTLGLDVHTDIISNSFFYKGTSIPNWLHSSEKDVQFVIKAMHQTLYQSINKTIYGELKSDNRLYGSRDLGQ